ncbi:hypothetical protein ACFQ1Q_11820 [Winogradskyella litorisediminis]|uniref:Lipoprotein n=1 Tax=Winogradskyella litorisediminis TaxID=1156618 RepID=A0ABW3NBR9_9FLAO
MKSLNVLLLFFLLINCDASKKEDSKLFEVNSQNVGLVTDSTLVKDLKFIFKNDSIVNYKEDDSFIGGLNAIEIFEKNGNHLLSIYPTDALDSMAKIDYIKLLDSRYKTAEGISNNSYYIDIKNAYKISEIKNELNALYLEVDAIKSSFIIDKKKLKKRFNFGVKIDSTQISDSTQVDVFIKYF